MPGPTRHAPPMRRPSRPPTSMPSSEELPGGTGAQSNVQVPNHITDPLQSMCSWPLTISVYGREFEVEALPAINWLYHLVPPVGEDHFDIMALIEDLLPGLEDFWFEEQLPYEELIKLTMSVISSVAARPWWIAFRLIGTAIASWHIIGPKMTMHGGDATVLSLSAWLDMVMFLIMDSIKPQEATMFTLKLELPPPNLGLDEEETVTELPATERSAFLAMAD